MDNIDVKHDVCDAFLEAFRRCDPEEEPENQDQMALPAIVCAAFSAEVGLKILLASCGVNRSGHDLSKLYHALPTHLQLQIRQGTSFPEDQFLTDLEYAKLAFVEWRYIYESPGFRSVSVYFLGKFASAIQFICARIRGAP